MRILVPDCGTAAAESARRRAFALAQPGDTVIIMAAVAVPRAFPVDAPAGAIWTQSCRAERILFSAQQATEGRVPSGVSVRFVRVQARTRADAILAGAAAHRADCILLPVAAGLRGALSARFGIVQAVMRHAPCPVRIIGAAQHTPEMDPSQPVVAPAPSGLYLVPIDPTYPTPEEQHAS